MKRVTFLLTTLVVLMGCSIPRLEISQIYFQADVCFGECPIFNMTIASDGGADYSAKMFNKLQGEFKTVIKKSQLDSLTMLIESANVFSLNNKYSMNWTDHPTYTLTIKLKNGKVKTIEDYGPSGPEKLKLVYRQIFSLRESQDWK
jgi:hypothetical protein